MKVTEQRRLAQTLALVRLRSCGTGSRDGVLAVAGFSAAAMRGGIFRRHNSRTRDTQQCRGYPSCHRMGRRSVAAIGGKHCLPDRRPHGPSRTQGHVGANGIRLPLGACHAPLREIAPINRTPAPAPSNPGQLRRARRLAVRLYWMLRAQRDNAQPVRMSGSPSSGVVPLQTGSRV